MQNLDRTTALKFTIWNVRSACKKLPDIIQYLCDSDTDILLLTETWFPPAKPGKLDPFSAFSKELLAAEDLEYSYHSVERSTGRRGGGVAILLKSTITSRRHHLPANLVPSSFEFVAVSIKSSVPLLVACIYRPDSASTASAFLSEFSIFLSNILDRFNSIVLAGDFNICLNLSNERNTQNFYRVVNEHGLSVIDPVSATHRSGNTLDFAILSRDLAENSRSIGVDDNWNISDHYPTLLNIQVPPITARTLGPPKRYRDFSVVSAEVRNCAIKQALDQIDISSIDSLQAYLSCMNNRLTDTLDSVAPYREGHTQHKPRPPWMDSEYVQARALRRQYQRNGDRVNYNAQRSLCSNLVVTKRSAYYNKVIDEASSDQGKLYKFINKLVDKKGQKPQLPDHSDPARLANSFNSYFVNKIRMIRSDLATNSVSPIIHNLQESDAHDGGQGQPSTPPGISKLDHLHPTNADEVRSIIRDSTIKTSPSDPLPAFCIKDNFEDLLPHLVNLINLSLSTSSFNGLKEAYVVPILKAPHLDVNDKKNYRPVSLLPFVSKLVERVVHNRVTSHLALNSLQNPKQYGYKRKHSCETLLVKMIDDILVGIDEGRGVILVIVDLSAAFDTVDHSILLNILRDKYHITGSALQWFRCYLTGRTQRVKIGDTFSEPLVISFGVPQGSVLGPLLFNLYSSSLSEVFECEGFDSVGYADDNFGYRYFPASAQLSTLNDVVPHCLASIQCWTDSHLLKLNSGKTKVMVFGNRQFRASLALSRAAIRFDLTLPFSESLRLLGVQLDDRLVFDDHISKITKSVNSTLRNIRKIRKYLNMSTAEKLVHSLVTTKLDQFNILFLGISEGNLRKLQVLQNNALRTLLRLPQHSHVSEHYQSLHWLNIEQRIHHKLLSTVFKCLCNQAPTELALKIVIASPEDMTLQAQYHPYSVAGKKSFSYLAPRCWNALPRHLRVLTDLEQFKASLKHYLFTNFNEYKHNVDPYTTTVIL